MTKCPICGSENAIVNRCGCDPNNLPTKINLGGERRMVGALGTTLKNRIGEERRVLIGDPCWCVLDDTRVRFSRQLPDGMIEVMNDDRTALPDLRHPSQLIAY